MEAKLLVQMLQDQLANGIDFKIQLVFKQTYRIETFNFLAAEETPQFKILGNSFMFDNPPKVIDCEDILIAEVV